MKTELTFKNDPRIKESLIKRMDRHIELDELLQGFTGQQGKGCTVWCALNNGDLKEGYRHESFPDVLGLPEWLARLQDTIFEGLNAEDSKWFSEEWVRAIPVGKDIEKVKWQFCAFILKENIERVLTLNIDEELKKQVVDAITGCLKLQQVAIETGVWDESAARSAAWSAARSAESAARSAAWSAESAARSAAWSAAWNAARSAAWSAAWNAARSAESAARSAESAARSAERSAAYKRYAVELLRLLSES